MDSRCIGNASANSSGEDAGSDQTSAQLNNSLTVLYTNAQSLVNKISEMRVVVSINNPDDLIVTETWTNETVSNNYLSIDIVARMDRNDMGCLSDKVSNNKEENECKNLYFVYVNSGEKTGLK